MGAVRAAENVEGMGAVEIAGAAGPEEVANDVEGMGTVERAEAVGAAEVAGGAEGKHAELGIPEFGDIVSVMSRTLGAANRCLVELMEREGLAGIVPSHGDILMQLFAHDSMPMAALACAIGKDPSTVTALVRKLEQAGYVEKLPSPKDRRVNEVRLTARGRKLEGAMGRISAELIAKMTRGISDADLRIARECLLAMQANLNDRPDSEENA